MGPFPISQKVGPVAYRLELGQRLRRVHPVFHVSLLRRSVEGGDGASPPEPLELDGELEYEVATIRQHRQRRDGTREFLVSWVGYDQSEDTWLPEAELEHA